MPEGRKQQQQQQQRVDRPLFPCRVPVHSEANLQSVHRVASQCALNTCAWVGPKGVEWKTRLVLLVAMRHTSM